MKQISITELNRNFSKLAREVDAEGQISIIKNGEEKYIIMQASEYKRLKGEIVWAKDDEGGIRKIELTPEYTYISAAIPVDECVYMYKRYRLPSSLVKAEREGDDIILDLDRSVVSALGKRDVAMLLKTSEVNVSDAHIARLDAKKDGEELDEILEVLGLLDEFKEFSSSHPMEIQRMQRI